MDFNEVINKRKTSREWTDRDVDFEVIKRIIEAGMKAPSWDHYRNWQFIVLHTREKKENAFGYAKLRAFAAEMGLDYVTNDDSMARPFEAPTVVVNYFYHEEIKKSARTERR